MMVAIHFIVACFVWLHCWRFSVIYNEAEHIGTLSKELAFEAFFAAYIALAVCGLIAAARNAVLQWTGADIILWIPFRGRTIIGGHK